VPHAALWLFWEGRGHCPWIVGANAGNHELNYTTTVTATATTAAAPAATTTTSYYYYYYYYSCYSCYYYFHYYYKLINPLIKSRPLYLAWLDVGFRIPLLGSFGKGGVNFCAWLDSFTIGSNELNEIN